MTLLSDAARVLEIVPQACVPTEVEFILSALEAGQHIGTERRCGTRRTYRATASLRLYSDHPQAPPWEIYVRDVSSRGLGFITRHRLPLGYGGILSILTPQHKPLRIDCTLVRCRQAVQGWFEGSMYFNREQSAFEQEGRKGTA